MRRIRLPFAPILLTSLLSQCSGAHSQESETKVIGGRVAADYPFMAALGGKDGYQFCGASFIRKDVAVTAAHCIHETYDEFWVAAGVRKASEISDRQKIPVRAVKIHPQYDPDTLHHDMALLFLDPDAARERGGSIAPIILEEEIVLPAQTSLRALGWGNATSEGRYKEDELQEVDVPSLTNDACRGSGGQYDSIEDHQICAGDLVAGGIDTCYGDSGGPLFRVVDGRSRLVGIVSWGEGCAEPGSPGVYTRVAFFRDWVTAELARYDTADEEVDGRKLTDWVETYCYAGISLETDAVANQAVLAATQWFDGKGDFAAVPFDPAQENLPLACSFTLPSHRRFDVRVQDARTSRPVVVITSSGEAWQRAARGSLAFDLDCKSALSRLEFSQLESAGYFSLDDRSYVFSTSPIDDVPPTEERETCAVEQTSYQHLVGRGQHFLRITSDLLAGTSRTYVLRTYNPGSPERGSSILRTHLTMRNQHQGHLSIMNESMRKIFGWQLSCNFSFQLSDIAADAVSIQETGMYKVQYSAADKEHGIIPANGSLEFQLRSDEPLTQGDMTKKCWLNGYAMDLW